MATQTTTATQPEASAATLWRCGGRQCGAGECEHEENELHRHASGPGPRHAPPVVHDVLRTSGTPLPAPVRADMEARLGHDFADVRIHTDQRAGESARAVAAAAYTVGRHVVFDRGGFDPASRAGSHLLAHELAHVAQHRHTPVRPSQPLRVSDPHDADEVAADRWAGEALRRLATRPQPPPGTARPGVEGAVDSIGSALGHDFSGVRVRGDAAATELTRHHGAAALTIGTDIYAAPGRLGLDDPRAVPLLLHELGHVRQHDPSKPPRIRRQLAGCAGLISQAGASLISGRAAHALILQDFARVPGALQVLIPGASAGPLRSQGICGEDSRVIPPQLLGGRAGAGFPDLARLNAGGILSVAEIKPAAVPCLVDGEEQLIRYIDQGNATDPPQVAWRTAQGISVVVPMLPAVYPARVIPAGNVVIETAWCNPGLLAYAVRTAPSRRRVRVRVTAEERARERARLEEQARARQQATVVAGAATAATVAVVAGRALWPHFWRAVMTRFAIRGAAAAALSLADGPLPFGELVSAGLAVVTIIQIGVEWNDLWREADRIAATEA